MKSCWQIRQELNGNGACWRIHCTDCGAFAAGASCWEIDTPSCCAPVHVTCDFCSLYIEHRREIANLTQDNSQSKAAGAPGPPDAGRPT